MSKKVGDLFVEILVDASSGNLSVRQLVGALGDLDVASLTSVGIIANVAEGLMNLAKSAMDSAVELTALHDLTDTDPKIVGQWEKAAHQIVGHTGAIIKSIEAVQKMNESIKAGGGTPAVVGQLLGMTPSKGFDKNHNAILKNAMDYMTEMAQPGSRYRMLPADLQRKATSDMFGSAGGDDYRLIKAKIAGKFHPELMPEMNDKQIAELNAIKMQEIGIGEKLTGVFEEIVLHGGGVAKALQAVSDGLDKLDKWLKSKEGNAAVTNVEAGIGSFFNLRNYNPFTLGSDMAKNMLGAPVAAPRMNEALRLDTISGSFDLNLHQNDKPTGTKKVYVDQSVIRRDFWDVTQTMGNTP